MSTQGILISGNSNIHSAENTKSRERTVVAAVPSGQENRSAENPHRNRVKSPAKLFKSQLRFSVNPKPDSNLLISNDKKNNLHTKTIPKPTTQVNPKHPVNPTTEGKPKPLPKPESIPSMIRRESANNFRTLKSSITNPRSGRANAGSNANNTNSLIGTNPKPTAQPTPAETKLRSTASISNLRIRPNQAVSANRTSSGNKTGASRTNSSHKQPPNPNVSIPLTRSSSNQRELRSPPPVSPKTPKYRPTSMGDISDKPRVIPEFPQAPANPEKHLPTGSDKFAAKIWMKERVMFDKWESSKKLFQMKLAEGNLSACQRIVDRLISEMEELTKTIREDECRKIFPEEPVKPAETCPLNMKDARLWHQQKVVYDAWDNAFKLFQENMAKDDTTACKKQTTIYNPQYKSDLSTQSSRRFDNLQISNSTEDIPPNSKSQVKFADSISISQNPLTNPNTHIVISKVRPKLQPPASWTKPRNREGQENNANLFKSQEVSMVDMPVSQEVKGDSTNDIEVIGTSEEVSHASDTSCKEHNLTSTSSDLIDAIDSVLAELDAKIFCNNLPS